MHRTTLLALSVGQRITKPCLALVTLALAATALVDGTCLAQQRGTPPTTSSTPV